jgi:hypothetical protein
MVTRFIIQCSSTYCYFVFFRPKYCPKHPAADYFYVSPLSVGDQISPPRTTTGKDDSTFSDVRREGRRFSAEW